jgi:ATP phosphoribosyltransferase
LIGNAKALRNQPDTLAVVRTMLEMIDAALEGKKYRQLTVNITGASPEDVAQKVANHEVTRGLKGPTISPIYGLMPDAEKLWYTVTVNVLSRDLLAAVNHLRQIGSSQVVVSPVNFVFQQQSPSYVSLLEVLG